METKQEIDVQKEYIKKVKQENTNKKLKYSILTMGCQLNENDSEKLSGMIEKMGYSKTDSFNESDLVLFNTCCVRENAEDRLFGKLGEIKRVKEQKGTIVCIGGCMMQEKQMVEKINNSYPFVDIIFGAYFEISGLGSAICGAIISFNICNLAFSVLLNASSINFEFV